MGVTLGQLEIYICIAYICAEAGKLDFEVCFKSIFSFIHSITSYPGRVLRGILTLDRESHVIFLFFFVSNQFGNIYLKGDSFILVSDSRPVVTPTICLNNSFPAFPSIIQKLPTMFFSSSTLSNHVIRMVMKQFMILVGWKCFFRGVCCAGLSGSDVLLRSPGVRLILLTHRTNYDSL